MAPDRAGRIRRERVMSAFAAGPLGMAHKSASDLPQSTQQSLFAIVGLVRFSAWGRITTTLGASGGSTIKYLVTPTVGATSTSLAAAADLGAGAAGAFVVPYHPVFATALSSGMGAAMNSSGQKPAGYEPIYWWAADGTIKLECSGNQSGQMEHWCFWAPMTPGSYVYSL